MKTYTNENQAKPAAIASVARGPMFSIIGTIAEEAKARKIARKPLFMQMSILWKYKVGW